MPPAASASVLKLLSDRFFFEAAVCHVGAICGVGFETVFVFVCDATLCGVGAVCGVGFETVSDLFFFEAAVCGVGAVRGVGFETIVCFLSTLFSALVPFAASVLKRLSDFLF